MSAPESYQLESLASEADGVKPASPTASVDPASVRWLNQGGRRWEVAKIVARVVSTLLCAIILIIAMAWYARPELDGYRVWLWLCLPGALPSFMWDLGEFLSVCARHGRGITPKAHIGVELVLSVLAYIGGGWLAFQLGLEQDGAFGSGPFGLAITQCTFMLITATIHLVLFIRACVERGREIRRRRPRVMYIPETGQTVYVVAKPFPKLPTRNPQQPQQQQQQQQSARAPSFPRPLDDHPFGGSPLRSDFQPLEPESELELELELELEVPPPLPARPGEVSTAGSSSSLPSSIKRKPVPGVPRNVAAGDRERLLRPSMRPPAEDYVPSGEELARRMRGDAQPQLILPGDVDIKFATSATGMTPAEASAREGKFRVGVPPQASAMPTGEPSSGGGGRA